MDILSIREMITLLEFNLPVWDLGGAWIDEFGKVEYTDHEQGHHHADIAMNSFDIESNDEGEYDEYCREAAFEAAFDNGWVRIFTNGTKEIGLEWAGEISKATQRGLINSYKTIQQHTKAM